MRRTLKTMFGLETYYFLSFYIVCQYPSYIGGTAAAIFWAPSNLTISVQSSSPAVFQCGGQGTLLLWYINGDIVVSSTRPTYEAKGFRFTHQVHSNNTIVNTLTIPARVENNNTLLSCHATGTPGPDTSENARLTIAGPPLPPQPVFHVVNATHIEVQWEKPFALPEFDIRYYTLSIWNTSSNSHVQPNQLVSVSTNTEYPIRYRISNGGNIPDSCVYLNFTLNASSDAGTSAVGFTTGGFAIAPSPIDSRTLHYEVTFSINITPMLHINFTFPDVCDYHDAIYVVTILDEDRRIYQTEDVLYNEDGPQNVEVDIRNGMEKNNRYTAVINVTTAVKSTTTEFVFNTSPLTGNPTPGIVTESSTSPQVGSLKPGIVTESSTSPQVGNVKPGIVTESNHKVIISSSVAGGCFIILLIVTVFLLTGFILRRRKLKRRMRAYQHDVDTDEAVQRAALAMIPNPIYSGNPIYDEIADPKLLKFLQNKDSEPQSRDEGYMEIPSQATNMFGGALQPNMGNKLVRDKSTTLSEDTYTFMNPVGTLSNQIWSSPEKGSAMMYSGGDETFSSEYPLGSATQSDGNQTGIGSSMSSSAFPIAHHQDELEERYVKGAF